MNRRSLVFAALALSIAIVTPAYADFEGDVIEWLRGQGFEQIDVSRTFLGRVRIVASNDKGTREVIFNPRTSEVLRNVWTSADDQTASGFGDSNSTQYSTDDGADDDGGDDGDDDDDSGDDNGDDDGGDDDDHGGDDDGDESDKD